MKLKDKIAARRDRKAASPPPTVVPGSTAEAPTRKVAKISRAPAEAAPPAKRRATSEKRQMFDDSDAEDMDRPQAAAEVWNDMDEAEVVDDSEIDDDDEDDDDALDMDGDDDDDLLPVERKSRKLDAAHRAEAAASQRDPLLQAGGSRHIV